MMNGKDEMSSKTFSMLVRCWYDLQTNATQIQLVRTDTVEEIHLEDGGYLLRIWVDEATSIGRCFIRHLASGREAYVQGGPNLQAFIEDCLLKGGKPSYSDPGPLDENET
jgi:hypothetical protein